MARHPRLQLRRGIYHFRAKVPEDVRDRVGKREIKKSLHTGDYRIAVREVRKLSVELDALFDTHRHVKVPQTTRAATALDFESIAKEAHREADERNLHGFFDLPPADYDEVLHNLRDDEIALRQGLNPATLPSLQDDLSERLRKRSLSADTTSLEYWKGLRLLLRAELEAVLRQRERFSNNPTEPHFDRLFDDGNDLSVALRAGPHQAAAAPIKGLKLYKWETLIKDWAAATDKKPTRDGKPHKTPYAWGKIVDKLIAFIGHDDAGKVSLEDREKWRDHLITLVANDGLNSVTLKNYLTVTQTLLKWAYRAKRITIEPEPVHYTAKKKQGAKKRGYTDDEARTVLIAARKQAKPFMRWCPWLCAYSGARIEEVAGAFASNVEYIDGIPVLHIEPEARGRDVKGIGSVRRVPIHSAVIDEGFLDYVRSLPESSPLFPECQPDMFGSRGGSASKKIGAWVRKELGITDKRVSPSHSWRHRIESEHRARDIRQDTTDAITGHHDGRAASDYGDFYVKETLRPAIEAIRVLLQSEPK
ncbi:MAG TPA: DUF6538 domain-containing protein [Stellaceae bacterium]|nr:DUF6538 domain-containing protein [Stellaceae bacterium]